MLSKKDLALELASSLQSFRPRTPADYQLLVGYLTLANPVKIEKGMSGPDVLFPAVRSLIEMGEEGGQAVLTAFEGEEINPTQTAINIAFVVSETLGIEESLEILKKQLEEEEVSERGTELRHRVLEILGALAVLPEESKKQEDESGEIAAIADTEIAGVPKDETTIQPPTESVVMEKDETTDRLLDENSGESKQWKDNASWILAISVLLGIAVVVWFYWKRP